MSSSSPSPIPPTPLSTRELRDKYARKALHADSPSQSTTNSLLPDGGVVRRRSPRKKPDKDGGGGGGTGTDSADGEMAGSLSSPPNQKFKESSPSVAGSAKPRSKDVTPGMSMIVKTGNGSAGRGRRSTFAVSDEEESSEGDTDDSQQPSAKVRVQPKSQSSTLTSRTGRNTSGLGKRSLNRTAASASRRSSGSFTDRSTSRLIEITREEERNEACKKFVTGFGIIAVMVSFMLLVFMQYEANSLAPPSGQDAEYWNKTLKSFKDEMKVLKQEFSAQDKRSWAVISSSVRGILKGHPSQPSVILLVSTDEKTRSTSECLAMKVAQLGSGVLGKAPPSKKPSDASQFLTKADLFNRMNYELASRGAFVLSRLETLSGAVAMALHGICDNLSAPQKQAVVVMLVDVGKLPDAAEENIEVVVEDVLTKKWEEQLDIDRIAPILSRITVSVVRVKEESKNACS